MLENIRQNLRLAFLRLVSPRVCLNCGTRLKDEGCFCAFCQAGIGFLPQALCRRCGAPEQICGHAAKKSGLLDGVWALAWHEGPIAAALAKFKYDGAQGHGQALGAYMAGKMEWIRQSEFDYIIPVPLHPRRLRKRGFNQAQILASYLRPEKLRVDLLVRIKDNRPQVGLSGRERLGNARGVFALSSRYKVDGLRILLVDDVWTTGATLRECARVLKGAGAARVGALTLTRSGESGK